MKRSLLVPLIVLALVTMACDLSFLKKPTPTSAPEPVVVEAEEATATAVPVEPTVPPAPPTEVVPTTAPEPTATEAPTEPPQPTEFQETFDRISDKWSDDLIVTTQTSGRDLYSLSSFQDGFLRFRFDDKETYMYKFFLDPLEGNVSVEASYQSKGHINNGIAIVCRANEERTSWFEVRVSSTSDFSFFRYDKKLKTEQNKNPYVLLGKGKFKIDQLHPTMPNVFKVTCLDDELILDANNGKRVVNQTLDQKLDGTYVGLGVMSYDVIPITVDFDVVTIRQEP